MLLCVTLFTFFNAKMNVIFFMSVCTVEVRYNFFPDFDNTSDQIKKTQIELRPKLSQLHEMEGKKDIRGFDLKALNKVELNAINRLL